MNSVAAMTLQSPKNAANNHVHMDDARMLTRLFPTNIVVSSFSYSSESFSAFSAFLLPSLTRFFSLILLTLVYAVSDAEKNAESTIKRRSATDDAMTRVSSI